MSTALIIGAGRIGQAINKVLKKTGTQIELCDSDEAKCPNQRPLTETVPEVDVIFLCIQSWITRSVLADIKPFLKPTTIIVSVAKGLEKETLKTLDQVMVESLPPEQPWGIMIGPMMAEEIDIGLGSAAVLASTKKETYEMLCSIFKPDDLRLEHSTDLRGVSLCGVLKNIYALGLGFADGIGWGLNHKGWLISVAAREMNTIVEQTGGASGTALGPAGLGDLVATALSPHSRDRTAGEEFVKTGVLNPLSEGVNSTRSLIQLLNNKIEHLPFLQTIQAVIEKQTDAQTAYENFINRDLVR